MSQKQATLYRMVTDEHVCPYGIKSKHLLERKGYLVDDIPLRNREETNAFKEKYDVKTTPQAFINDERIGGYDDLKLYFGMTTKEQLDSDKASYQPVIAVFASAALMAIAGTWASKGTLISMQSIEWFIAISVCILAVQKLRDVSSFSSQFLSYDLLARKDVRYAYFYPYAELASGVLMLASTLLWIAIPLMMFIGTVGAISVFKAVYIEKRDIKCACVGGNSNVPLGAVSLTENLMMVLMGVWMLIR